MEEKNKSSGLENKKIKGAQEVTIGDIHFKSKLEGKVYQALLASGIKAEYEPTTISLWKGHIPRTPFYTKDNSKNIKRGVFRHLILKKNKLVDIKYTPDFYFRYGDLDVWMEIKGYENDVFYIKKKLFIDYLDNKLHTSKQKSIYFEIFNISQLHEALEIIKNYDRNKSTSD